MKILITAPSLDEKQNVSGISTIVRQIIKGSRQSFYHFQAGRIDGEKSDFKWLLKQTFLPVRFFQTLRREKIDVAHINTALNSFSIIRDFALVVTARTLKIPVLLHIHGGRFLAEDFQNTYLALTAEKMMRASQTVVVLSETEKKIIENRWKNLALKVLENAVSIDEFPNVRREREGEKTFIFFGRLHESKGLMEIIEACKTLKKEGYKFRFNCYGAGEAKDFFIAEMREILDENFFYGGVAAGAEKNQALTEADIFLLPSRYGEGLPMAMLEALASGCIVIVSEMASVGAVIENGSNGFLVEPGNIPQLTETLKLILSNRIDTETMKKNARQTVEKNFNLSGYIKKLETIYEEIKR